MHSKQVVEGLFRKEYGKLVATLTRIFGPSHIQLAEDMVQDTLISALNHWSVDGIPQNPTGWLVQVSKRKALNELKRQKRMQYYQTENLIHHPDSPIDAVFLQNEINDSQLRMIFTCCHPSLSVESQIALTLKTLCGFGVREVANAFLTNQATINKRLYRAKNGIRKSKVPFNIPHGKELESRLETVNLTLYLLFNEGYNSTGSDSIIKKELCLEAIRLTKLLVDHFNENKKLYALLSLMCLHAARFDARIDDQGAIILFEDQDRKLWNQELINSGMQYLKRSMNDESLSVYHVEASISAEHCLAESFHSTNWQSIYRHYLLLEKLKPSPIISLNLAIIQSQISGLEASLTLLDRLGHDKALRNYHLLPATQGVFNMKLGRYRQAITYLQKARELNPSLAEYQLIDHKISECKKLLVGLTP